MNRKASAKSDKAAAKTEPPAKDVAKPEAAAKAATKTMPRLKAARSPRCSWDRSKRAGSIRSRSAVGHTSFRCRNRSICWISPTGLAACSACWRSWESRSSSRRTGARSRVALSFGGWRCSGVLASWSCAFRPAFNRWIRRARRSKSVLDCALEGAEFVFGKPLVDRNGPGQFVFAFRVLPTVIFVAALFAVLYHIGVMQWVVRAFAWVMLRLFGTSGAESLNVAASLFLGQTEAPLTIRPYLSKLTKSELLTVMTSGMAHVSGGVMAAYMAFGVEARHILTAVIMTAPGSILLSKMLVPETGKPETLGTVHSTETSTDANVLDAASRGTRDGLHLALNIAAMLISFLALIALVNMGLGRLGDALNYPGLSLQTILGWAMAPVAYMLGVAWEDCRAIGSAPGHSHRPQ